MEEIQMGLQSIVSYMDLNPFDSKTSSKNLNSSVHISELGSISSYAVLALVYVTKLVQYA